MSAQQIETRIPKGVAEKLGINVVATAMEVYGATYVARRAHAYDVTITIDGARRLLTDVIRVTLRDGMAVPVKTIESAKLFRRTLARKIVDAEARARGDVQCNVCEEWTGSTVRDERGNIVCEGCAT